MDGAYSIAHADQVGLGRRSALMVLVLIGESLIHTSVFRSVAYAGGGTAHGVVQAGLHTAFRFIIAYLAFALMLHGTHQKSREDSAAVVEARFRPRWAAVHVGLIGILAALSYEMHADVTAPRFWLLASMWFICGTAAVAALFLSLAEAPRWLSTLRARRVVLMGAILPAAAAVAVFNFSQLLWAYAARITFSLVYSELHLFIPDLYSDSTTRTVGTERFLVLITDACSGMEGLALTLVSCAVILWLYRRDLRFPRAFVIIPAALILMFVLNSLRIAALVAIGNAGHPEVASVGFHSQAGWILFNMVALSVAVVAGRAPWLRAVPAHSTAVGRSGLSADNPVAPYLMPLVVTLAAAMLGQALSAGFDFFYASRVVAAGIVVWIYRRPLVRLPWRCSWRGPCVGGLVFALWVMADARMNVHQDMPEALASLSGFAKTSWIVCRAAGAILVVPVVEELAFRGYLMRLFASREFDSVRFREVRWPALIMSSLVFGMVHGAMWLPGILAGLAYGVIVIRTDHFGEAAAAHATTNALLAVSVLVFNQWQLW